MRIENTVFNQPDAKQPLDICKNVLSYQQLNPESLVLETTPTQPHWKLNLLCFLVCQPLYHTSIEAYDWTKHAYDHCLLPQFQPQLSCLLLLFDELVSSLILAFFPSTAGGSSALPGFLVSVCRISIRPGPRLHHARIAA